MNREPDSDGAFAMLDAEKMMKILSEEGLSTLRLCPERVHPQSFKRHFKIIDGLCDFLDTTANSTDKSTYNLIKIRDIMIRIEKQLCWISMNNGIYSKELRLMNDCFFKHCYEGIKDLPWAADVKAANNQHALKVDAYFKLVDINSTPELTQATLFLDWTDYFTTLEKQWEAKNILVYVKKNQALELRRRAESIRTSLWDEGLISQSLLDDLKKVEDGHDYYNISPNLLIDPSFSPIKNFYDSYLSRPLYLFNALQRLCEPKEDEAFDKKEMEEVVETLESYMKRICGSKMSTLVGNLKRECGTSNCERIKLAIDGVKKELDELDDKIEKYFELGKEIIKSEAIECWVKLKVAGSGSGNTESSDDTKCSSE